MVKTKSDISEAFPKLPRQDDFEVVRDVKAVCRNLELKQKKLADEIQRLETTLSQRDRETVDRNEQAELVRQGKPIGPAVDVAGFPKLHELRRQLDIVERAIRLQKIEINRIVVGICEKACKPLAAPYEALVLKAARAAIEFAEANQKITQILQHLSGERLSHGRLLDLNAGCPWIDPPGNPNGRLAIWLHELRSRARRVIRDCLFPK